MYLYVPNYYKVNKELKYISLSNWEEQYQEYINSFKNQKEESILDTLREIFGNSDIVEDLVSTEDNIPTVAMSKEEFHKKAIENRITEIQKELAQLSNNASNFIAPIQTNILEVSAQRAMKAVYGDNYETAAEYYKSKATLPSILDSTYVLQVAENYMAGKKEVGIAANAGKFYVYAAMYNLGIPADNVKIHFEHNEEDHIVQLGRKTTAGSNPLPISELLNQWISAAVDAAKSPFGVNLGATPATLGTLTMLTMAGVHPDVLALFMNQPIIREYLALQQQHESQIAQENYVAHSKRKPNAKVIRHEAIARLTKESIQNLLAQKYPAIDQTVPAKVFTATDLESYIVNKDYTYQNQILQDFLRYVEWGRHIADAMQGTTYDTQNGGKNLSELLLKLYKSQTAGARVYNYDKLIDGGYISGYMNTVAEFKDFFKPMFLLLRDQQFTNGFNGLFDIMISSYVNNTTLSESNIVQSLNKFKNDFLTAIILNTPDAEGKTIISDRNRIMVGENSVPVKLLKLRNDPAYKDNPLFQALVPILDTIKPGVHNIRPFVDKDVLTSNAVTYAWQQLYLSDKAFALDLIKFCLLQSGLQMSPLNFIDIIPANIYKEFITPMLNNYQAIGYNVLREAFIYAWQLSNYNDDNILPFDLRFADALPLGKRYETDEDGLKTKRVFPMIRWYNEDKQQYEFSRLSWEQDNVSYNYQLDNQQLNRNHQRQIYNFEPNSALMQMINKIAPLRQLAVNKSDEVVNEENSDLDFKNNISDNTVFKINSFNDTVEYEVLDEVNKPVTNNDNLKDFIQLGEERQKLCK